MLAIIRNRFSIRTRITFWIVFSVLSMVFVALLASFIHAKNVSREDLRMRLLDVVSIAALEIDTEKHGALNVFADEQTDEYKNVKKTLQSIRDAGADIKYVYTIRENEKDEIMFVVDAEEKEEEIAHLGVIYTDAGSFLSDNFLTMSHPMVGTDFSTDRWGTWLSGYAPFYKKDGSREGILGIDIEAATVLAEEKNILYRYILYFIFSGICSVLVGIFLGSKISKNISMITENIKGVGNKTKNKKTILGTDEIGDLSNAVNVSIEESENEQKELISRLEQKTDDLERVNKLMVGRELEMIKLKKEIEELKK